MIFKKFLYIIFVTLVLASCGKDTSKTGMEFAPQMYVSVPYEPYTQVKENSINPMGLNVRQPAEGTIARRWINANQRERYEAMFASTDSAGTEVDLMLYNTHKDSLEKAAATLKNPLEPTEEVLKEGKRLYDAYCEHCHGKTGEGDGLVAQKYNGIANIALKPEMNHGHIFHVITHGKNLMWAHGSQLSPAERWKIVHYIKTEMHGEGEEEEGTEEGAEENTEEGATGGGNG